MLQSTHSGTRVLRNRDQRVWGDTARTLVLVGVLIMAGAIATVQQPSAGSMQRTEGSGMLAADFSTTRQVHLAVASDLLLGSGLTGPKSAKVEVLASEEQIQYRFEDITTVHPQLARTSDHSRIFVLTGGVSALDASTGDTLWYAETPYRIGYINGIGPAALAVSPDARWVYVYNMDMSGASSEANVAYWIDVYAADNGAHIGRTDVIPGCGVARLLVNDSFAGLTLVCMDNQSVHQFAISDSDHQVNMPALPPARITSTAPMRGLPGRIIDAFLSENGTRVIVVTDTLRIVEVDLVARETTGTLELLTRDEQSMLMARAIGVSADASTFFVTLQKIDDATQLQHSSPDGHGEIRAYTVSDWTEISRMSLRNRPMNIPFVIDESGSTAYLIDYEYIEGSADPIETRVLAVNPSESTVDVVVSRPGERILQAVPFFVEADPGT